MVNERFNEPATRWHTDHVYRHEPTVLLIFTLLAMLCLNVLLALYRRVSTAFSGTTTCD